MTVTRGQNFKEIPINVVGSSIFGRYPKISVEKTINMFISDNWLVNFSGYQIAIPASSFVNGGVGRGNHTSNKLGKLICVVGAFVYLVDIFFDQNIDMTYDISVTLLNSSLPLATSVGTVYISENNTPQIAISDGVHVYIYDPFNSTSTFYIMTGDGANPSAKPINFDPGFIDFHDTYFLIAAANNTNFTPPANNTWRLTSINPSTGFVYVDESAAGQSANTGIISTKPDNVQAVIRMPSKGNMVIVLGKTVAEPWYDQGLQLFPYVRSTAFSIDYGCLNPATIATNDVIAVWLAQNEKSGPIIMFTTGGEPEKITTDGIDYLFSQMKNPSDSQGFLMRQDGHLQYIINFYTDNLSLMYDFNTKKFFNLTDENLNFFIANEVAFFNNQYYFLTNKNGNLYAFDTIYTTYNGAEIPRVRTCKSVRAPDQSYRIANDIGFTIESGETQYQQEDGGPIYLETQDEKLIITQAGSIFFITQDNNFIITQDGNNLTFQDLDLTNFSNLIDQNNLVLYITPRVDLSVSWDGGASFSSDMPYELPGLGQRKNRIMWWQLGVFNDFTPQFKFWGLGRFVATDGILNVRK